MSLTASLRDMLNEHLTHPAHHGGADPDALVFPEQPGCPLRHELFCRRHFKPTVRRALPPPVRLEASAKSQYGVDE